ncbi:hypothetical protein AVEN_50470-1 [Araneus ventricosus]|uniref:Uncharacterized protein n=1 Tax=Araneus ventricosus TaxID=182803 RepID=A0A4Y2ARR4_ARAVE|nr:hypothetical protein AVEN_50470-1 [Araneus ventricosus]
MTRNLILNVISESNCSADSLLPPDRISNCQRNAEFSKLERNFLRFLPFSCKRASVLMRSPRIGKRYRRRAPLPSSKESFELFSSQGKGQKYESQ